MGQAPWGGGGRSSFELLPALHLLLAHLVQARQDCVLMVWLLWWVQARSPQLQDDPSLVWTIIFSWQENEHNSQLPHQAFCPQSPLLSPDFRREFQWAKIAALFLYILSSGIFCRIFWWYTDLSFLMRTWACPDAQPYSHEGTFKPWFHSHALDKTLFLDLSWGVSEPNITLCRASGVTERKQNWVLQPLSLLCCLKDLGKTLDPNQMRLGFCKSSTVRTCSTFYPNLLFSRWDSRRHSQCCYIHLLYPICHAATQR